MVGDPEAPKYISRLSLVESAAGMALTEARDKVSRKLNDFLNTEELTGTMSMNLVRALKSLQNRYDEFQLISILRGNIVSKLLGEYMNVEECECDLEEEVPAPKKTQAKTKK